MLKTNLQLLLAREIDHLNIRIDKKILKGHSYKKDAQTHKLLRAKLESVSRGKKGMVSISSLLSV